MKYILSVLLLFIFYLLPLQAIAADSYRYLHVTIDTPWMIFIFLLVIILFPFILMAVLYWYFAFKKDEKGDTADQRPAEAETVIDRPANKSE